MGMILLLWTLSNNGITTPLQAQAYHAYSPYKESFRYFWHSLSEDQQNKLKKELNEHLTLYLESKNKSRSYLKSKKISSGAFWAFIIPSLSLLTGVLLIIMIKDFTTLSQTIRATFAALIACQAGASFISGLSKIIKGICYKRRLEKRCNRDQILLQAIGTYEQES